MRQWIIASFCIIIPFCIGAAVYTSESRKPVVKPDPDRTAGAVTWRANPPSAYNRAQPAKAWRLEISVTPELAKLIATANTDSQKPPFNWSMAGFPDYNQCARAINWTAVNASNGRMKVQCVETDLLVKGAR